MKICCLRSQYISCYTLCVRFYPLVFNLTRQSEATTWKAYTGTPYSVSTTGLWTWGHSACAWQSNSIHQFPDIENWYLIRIMNNATTISVSRVKLFIRFSICYILSKSIGWGHSRNPLCIAQWQDWQQNTISFRTSLLGWCASTLYLSLQHIGHILGLFPNLAMKWLVFECNGQYHIFAILIFLFSSSSAACSLLYLLFHSIILSLFSMLYFIVYSWFFSLWAFLYSALHSLQ